MNAIVIIGLGLIAGLRATVAPAVLSHFLSQRPPRIYLPGLGMRIASGSLVGAAVAGGNLRRMFSGALLGGLAAAAGAYGGFALRTWARSRFNLPDTLVGAVEDALAAGAGVGLGSQIDPGSGMFG